VGPNVHDRRGVESRRSGLPAARDRCDAPGVVNPDFAAEAGRLLGATASWRLSGTIRPATTSATRAASAENVATRKMRLSTARATGLMGTRAPRSSQRGPAGPGAGRRDALSPLHDARLLHDAHVLPVDVAAPRHTPADAELDRRAWRERRGELAGTSTVARPRRIREEVLEPGDVSRGADGDANRDEARDIGRVHPLDLGFDVGPVRDRETCPCGARRVLLRLSATRGPASNATALRVAPPRRAPWRAMRRAPVARFRGALGATGFGGFTAASRP
jgi:hypothetical protein